MAAAPALCSVGDCLSSSELLVKIACCRAGGQCVFGATRTRVEGDEIAGLRRDFEREAQIASRSGGTLEGRRASGRRVAGPVGAGEGGVAARRPPSRARPARALAATRAVTRRPARQRRRQRERDGRRTRRPSARRTRASARPTRTCPDAHSGSAQPPSWRSGRPERLALDRRAGAGVRPKRERVESTTAARPPSGGIAKR